MLALLGVTWFIKYPDLLTATVVITTTPAPVNLVARTGGRIQLLKQVQVSCVSETTRLHLEVTVRIFLGTLAVHSCMTFKPKPLGELSS
ncbi:MAG: hypothetical protein KF856_11380 [Cyclobacteriaceae bacterium]|nr:hypothetical protein [Cyclobacteriaceae bacterium]